MWFGLLGDCGTIHRNREKSEFRRRLRVEEEQGEIIIAVINMLHLKCLGIILVDMLRGELDGSGYLPPQ